MVRFLSPNAAAFVMLDDAAEQVFQVLQRPLTDEGVLTPEQLPALMAQVEAAMTSSRADAAERQSRADAARAQLASQPDLDPDTIKAIESAVAAPVGLHQRLVPLRDMMVKAMAADDPIVWQRS